MMAFCLINYYTSLKKSFGKISTNIGCLKTLSRRDALGAFAFDLILLVKKV